MPELQKLKTTEPAPTQKLTVSQWEENKTARCAGHPKNAGYLKNGTPLEKENGTSFPMIADSSANDEVMTEM